MSKERLKSASSKKIGLPPVPLDSKQRVDELRKIYGREGSASYKHSMPSTSTQDLPQFVERSRSIDGKRGKSLNTRLISRGRLNSSSEHYGRSTSRERIDDMQEALLRAKKANSQLQLDNRILQTKLHKLSREAARREAHLQMLVANKMGAAEMYDTQMAMTLTSITKKEIEMEQTIEAQNLALNELRDQLVSLSNGEITVEQIKSPLLEETSQQNQELVKNTKRKIELAKQYAEQNLKLKERLRQLRTELNTLRRLKKGEASNGTLSNGSVSTGAGNSVLSDRYEEAELVEVIRRLKIEKETSDRRFRKRIQQLGAQFEQATEQLHNLGEENEHLRAMIDKLQKVSEPNLHSDSSEYVPIEIPKLDMSHIDSIDSAPTPYSEEGEFEEPEGEEEEFDELDDEVIARVVYECAASHVARSEFMKEDYKNQESISILNEPHENEKSDDQFYGSAQRVSH